MVAWIGFIILTLCAITLGYMDRRLWGTMITPGVVLIGGYAFAGGIYAITTSFYQVNEISLLTYLALVLFSAICLASSAFTKYLISWNISEIRKPALGEIKGARLLFLLTIFIWMAWAVIKAMASGGLWSTGATTALASGPISHLHVLLSLTIVWIAVVMSHGWGKTIMLGAGIIALAIYPVKGWTLIPLTAIILTSATQIHVFKRWFLLGGVLTVVSSLFFFGLYFSRLISSEGSAFDFANASDQISKLFLHYLTTGLVGLDAVVNGLRLPGGVEVLFAPVSNVLSLLTGDKFVNIISENYIDYSIDTYEVGSNVGSFIGTLVAYGGPIIGVVLASMWLIFSYILLGVSWRSRSAVLRAAVFYMMAMFSFGWFEYYFWNLAIYEILVLALIIFISGRLIRASINSQQRKMLITQSQTGIVF